MKTILGFLILVIPLVSLKAKKKLTIWNNKVEIGHKKDSLSISAAVYTLSEKIEHVLVDTSGQLINFRTKKRKSHDRGKLFTYDTQSKSITWSRKYNYFSEEVFNINNTIVITGRDTTEAFDFKTGKIKWNSENSVVRIFDNINIGITYDIRSLNFFKLQAVATAIDLRNGRELWSRGIKNDYLNDIFLIDSGNLLIESNELHKLEVDNGTGWSYDAITNRIDDSNDITPTSNDSSYSFWDFFDPPSSRIIRPISSNKLIEGDFLYFASAGKISKLNLDSGTEVWSAPLPKKYTSKSEIYLVDDKIYMVNLGYANSNNISILYGKPFFACFDSTNGEQKFLTELTVLDQADLLDYARQDDGIEVMFKDRIEKYDLEGKIVDRILVRPSFGNFTGYINDNIFIKKDHGYFPMKPSDLSMVKTSNDHYIIYNDQLDIKESTLMSKTYYSYLTINHYKFIAWEDKTIVVDSVGSKVAELNLSSKAFRKGNKLYEIKGRQLFVVDLNDVFDLSKSN